jgi:hypothetical protein
MATKKSVWVLFGILVISVWVLGSVTQAGAETSFDCTQCGSSTQTVLLATEELSVRSVDFKGIIMSNLENKVFDNMTTH